MNLLQLKVNEIAYSYFKRGCREIKNTNRSKCVDELKTIYDGKPDADPWCAQSLWAFWEIASKDQGAKNPLPKTASAKGLLNDCKAKGYTIGLKPSPGNPFYHLSSSPKASGHVGQVYKVYPDGSFDVVAGNTGGAVAKYRIKEEGIARLQMKFMYVFPYVEGDNGITTEPESTLDIVSSLFYSSLAIFFVYVFTKK